jgi:hypothetical protein
VTVITLFYEETVTAAGSPCWTRARVLDVLMIYHGQRQLDDGGRLLGIEVLDHIVIGRGRYVSLKDRVAI